jgi:hypothetical protein
VRTCVIQSTAILLVLFSGTRATAQERDRFGLVMGPPASVGVIVPVATWLSLRPDVSVSRVSTTSPTVTSTNGTVVGVSDSTFTSWNVTVGVSALFYAGRWDNLRTYVSPRFAFLKTAQSSTLPGTFEANLDQIGYLTSGSFGARYTLGPHFGVFGEVGLTHTYMTHRISSQLSGVPLQLDPKERMHFLETRSVAGVILSF